MEGEMPAVYNCWTVKARKTHKCCECQAPILRTESYWKVTGLWDGKWAEYKTCKFCHTLREKLRREGDEACLGMLEESIFESEHVRAATQMLSHKLFKGVPVPERDWNWLRDVVAPKPAIKCAAILYAGKAYEGPAHCNIGHQMLNDGVCRPPYPGGATQGFVLLGEGWFVSRREALQIALAAGQVLPGKHQHPSQLFSEDLRYDKK